MPAPVDVVTLGSSILSVLCFVSLFVSSKPVTFGSVVMTIVLALSATQAVYGAFALADARGLPTPPQAPSEGEDVFAKARTLWDWASHSLNGHNRVEL